MAPKDWEAIDDETARSLLLAADATVNPSVGTPQGRTRFNLRANGVGEGLNQYEPYDTRTCLRGSGQPHERNRSFGNERYGAADSETFEGDTEPRVISLLFRFEPIKNNTTPTSPLQTLASL